MKKWIIISSLVLAIILIFSFSSVSKNMIHNELIGQTFEGEFDDTVVAVTFINKNLCEISVTENYRGSTSDNLAYYNIKQKWFYNEFNWEYAGYGSAPESNEPFKISRKNGELVFKTNEFSDETAYIELTKKKLKHWEK